MSQDFPFLHPSETSVLNRLCRLGTDYIPFTEFIERYTGHVQQQVGGRPLRTVVMFFIRLAFGLRRAPSIGSINSNINNSVTNNINDRNIYRVTEFEN